MTQTAIINDFLVRIFNKVLVCEQKCLASHVRDLSVNEMHVISSVARLAVMDKSTVTNIAKSLSLSPAAMSISVSKLVKKGYLIRRTSEKDRRRVYVFLTPKGKKINEYHDAFHRRMVSGIASSLDEKELSMVCRSLAKLTEFFDRQQNI